MINLTENEVNILVSAICLAVWGRCSYLLSNERQWGAIKVKTRVLRGSFSIRTWQSGKCAASKKVGS